MQLHLAEGTHYGLPRSELLIPKGDLRDKRLWVQFRE